MTIEPSGPQIQFLRRTKLVSKKWRRPKMMFTVPGGPQIQFLWNHILQIRAAGTNVRRSEPSGPQIQFLWRTKLVSKMWSGPKMMFTVPRGPQIQFLWKHILQIRAAGTRWKLLAAWWSRRRRDLKRKVQQNSAGCWQQVNHIRQGARERRGDCHRSCAAREVCERRDDARIPFKILHWRRARACSWQMWGGRPRHAARPERPRLHLPWGLLPATTCCCAICAAVRRPQVWILGWCSSFEQSDACMHVYMCVCSETASETAWNACLKNLS